jgi:hypothetical protein
LKAAALRQILAAVRGAKKMNSAPKGGKQEYLARKKKRIDKMFLGGIGNVEKALDRPLKVTRRPTSKYSTSMTFHWKMFNIPRSVEAFRELWVVEGVVQVITRNISSRGPHHGRCPLVVATSQSVAQDIR